MDNINIFVSSTCYDLAQIRTDISEFIYSAGHKPILSEFENFPISPELDTVENCIKIVKDNADILILIVGNRYGSVIDNGKSITNNEFLVAKRKGIPIFCFIERTTLNALSFWKANKDADFSYLVDNVQIFEFVDYIRSDSKIWTFPFDKAQDIVAILKIQLSYLFKNSLLIRNKVLNETPEIFKMDISEKCLKILIQENELFEFEFLAQSLVDEINKKSFLKNDIEYSILTEPKHHINEVNEIPKWMQERLSHLTNLFEGINNLLDTALPYFLKEPGISADIKGLVYIAVKYSAIYESLLRWIIDTESTSIRNDFSKIKSSLSKLAQPIADQIWNFPLSLLKTIEDRKKDILLGKPVEEIKVILELSLDQSRLIELHTFTDKIKHQY